MPERAMKICNHPGCNRAIPSDASYCERHASLHVNADRHRQYDAARPASHRFYHTARWQRIRDSFITRHPLCCKCYERGIVKQAEIVDHIIEISDGGSLTSVDNLQSLCRYCHAEKTNNERRNRESSKS